MKPGAKQRALVLTDPLPVAAEGRCRDCGEPIYLPDATCFATVANDDRRCPWSKWGWHEIEQVTK